MPTPSIDQPDLRIFCGSSWVRDSLQQCRALEMGRALDAKVLPLVGFAIRWAPFGGAEPEELFRKFGVTRQRFLELVAEALKPRGSDDPHTRQLKRHLQVTLARAWRSEPGAPTPAARPGPAATHEPVVSTPSGRGRHPASVRSGT